MKRTIKIVACGFLTSAYVGAMLLTASAGAVGESKADKRTSSSKMLEKAPAEARAMMNPYEGQREATIAGAKLFRRHCADCHGDEAVGTKRAPALRSADVQQTPAGSLFWFVRNGNLRAGMPSWSGLPAQQIWQLVSYLKSMNPEGAEKK